MIRTVTGGYLIVKAQITGDSNTITMYEDLKDLRTKFNWDLVKIDNWVFRLHYVAR